MTTRSVDSQAGEIIEASMAMTVSTLQEDIMHGKPVALLLCYIERKFYRNILVRIFEPSVVVLKRYESVEGLASNNIVAAKIAILEMID